MECQRHSKQIDLDQTTVDLDLWDSPGIQEIDHWRQPAYSSAQCILICFPIASPDSLDNVREKVSILPDQDIESKKV